MTRILICSEQECILGRTSLPALRSRVPPREPTFTSRGFAPPLVSGEQFFSSSVLSNHFFSYVPLMPCQSNHTSLPPKQPLPMVRHILSPADPPCKLFSNPARQALKWERGHVSRKDDIKYRAGGCLDGPFSCFEPPIWSCFLFLPGFFPFCDGYYVVWLLGLLVFLNLSFGTITAGPLAKMNIHFPFFHHLMPLFFPCSLCWHRLRIGMFA